MKRLTRKFTRAIQKIKVRVEDRETQNTFIHIEREVLDLYHRYETLKKILSLDEEEILRNREDIVQLTNDMILIFSEIVYSVSSMNTQNEFTKNNKIRIFVDYMLYVPIEIESLETEVYKMFDMDSRDNQMVHEIQFNLETSRNKSGAIDIKNKELYKKKKELFYNFDLKIMEETAKDNVSLIHKLSFTIVIFIMSVLSYIFMVIFFN